MKGVRLFIVVASRCANLSFWNSITLSVIKSNPIKNVAWNVCSNGDVFEFHTTDQVCTVKLQITLS